MKRGIQLKQLNKQDLGLLGLPETVRQQPATDELGTSSEPIPLGSPLPPAVAHEVRKELEDMLRLLEEVSVGGTTQIKSRGTDPEE